ncbi:MAG: GtrA family protein [Hydrogenophilaceae bacterium]|nr:GtrA family protein [Hydrogenophilaceae bacterium]
MRRELLTAARFGLVGIAATAVHILTVWTLLSVTLLPAIVANLVAFLTAFGVSFAGNYLWTFRTPGYPTEAARRFFVISGGAFVANTLLFASLLKGAWFSPTVSAIVSATVVPVISFTASRLWGFRRQTKDIGDPNPPATKSTKSESTKRWHSLP